MYDHIFYEYSEINEKVVVTIYRKTYIITYQSSESLSARDRISGQSGGWNQRRGRLSGRDVSAGRSNNNDVSRGRSRSLDRSDSFAETTRRKDGRRDNNRSDRIHNNGRDYDRNGSYNRQTDNRSHR